MDRDLVERAIRGDRDAYTELVRQSIDHSYALATLLLRDPDFCERHRPEFVIRTGDLPTSKPLRTWLPPGSASRRFWPYRAIQKPPRHLFAPQFSALLVRRWRPEIFRRLRSTRATRFASPNPSLADLTQARTLESRF